MSIIIPRCSRRQIKNRIFAKLLNGGTVTERRDSPKARLWDELAEKGIVSTYPGKNGLMIILLSRGNGTSFKPLYKPAAARSSNHLRNWSFVRSLARSKGQ
jgi:hypothetical protein